MAHSLSVGGSTAIPEGRRTFVFRPPGAGKPMFGALFSPACEVGDGVFFCPWNWRHVLGQTRRILRASFSLAVTVRHSR